jgi:endonuclease/exonuclease/phosphatase family metal-dependent hydrolase
MSFVGCHLAAHTEHLARRNSDYRDVIAGASLCPASVHRMDFAQQSHHTVWAGDLNYRLQYGSPEEVNLRKPTPANFATVAKNLESRSILNAFMFV